MLSYSQSFGDDTKTLAEWGWPPSKWDFQTSYYVDSYDYGYGTVLCEAYLVFSGLAIFAYREPDKEKWFLVIINNPFGKNIVFEDRDYDDLWTISNTATKLSTDGQKYLKVIATKGLNIRTGPGTSYNIVGQVSYNEELIYLDYSSGWYKIKTKGGIEGWVCEGMNGEIWIR